LAAGATLLARDLPHHPADLARDLATGATLLARDLPDHSADLPRDLAPHPGTLPGCHRVPPFERKRLGDGLVRIITPTTSSSVRNFARHVRTARRTETYRL